MSVGRIEERNRRMLRARDEIDRRFADPLDVGALARIAICSEGAFIRGFKATFGETPHRYLQRRRVERAMLLLRNTDLPASRICVEVGLASLSTFTRTFVRVVGETPGRFRERGPVPEVPNCFVMSWLRPVGFGQTAAPRGD